MVLSRLRMQWTDIVSRATIACFLQILLKSLRRNARARQSLGNWLENVSKLCFGH